MSVSRYIPFTQQPYCCVPTCMQMILYKNGLPLPSQEAIGKDLGLVVPTEDRALFSDVESSDVPIVSSGFGTRVQEDSYSIPRFIEMHGLPFTFHYSAASEIVSPEDLAKRLARSEDHDDDVMVCFEVDAMYKNGHHYGHVCVFDTVRKDHITLVDPSPNHPKQLRTDPKTLHQAITKHGDKNYAGLWILKKQGENIKDGKPV